MYCNPSNSRNFHSERYASAIADIDRKLRNNKIQAQKFIGLSAKSAFEGARKNNSNLITASNINDFYNVVNNVIVPNRDNYKQNFLFDEIAYLIKRFSSDLKIQKGRVSQMERTVQNRFTYLDGEGI